MAFIQEHVRQNLPKNGTASRAEQLLNSVWRMQECTNVPAFCQVTMDELCHVFGEMENCRFLRVAQGAGFADMAFVDTLISHGDSPTTPPLINDSQQVAIRQAINTGESFFDRQFAALALVRNDKTLAVILLQSKEHWDQGTIILLNQFAKNAARGFETAALLQDAETLAFQDTLTSLGNRLSFKKHIQSAIDEHGAGKQSPFVVLQFVLDNLPELNIALGHSMGDELLRQVAKKLTQMFPQAVSLARTSGDGFGICTEYSSSDEVSVLPDVINELFDIYLPDELKLPHLTPRIGLSLYPSDGTTADQLWQNTNIALAKTKKPGNPNFCLYDNQIEEEIHGRITLNNALRKGMSLKQLSLNYQPQICLQTGQMTGVEALLRWEREEGHFVPADIFIPIAEASGLLGPISDWVLREACRQRQAWTEEGVTEFPVAVNISLNEFQSDDFVPLVRQVLTETGLPARLLDIELTESVIMLDRGQTKKNMLRLKGLGVRLSIDDFGTGYSSLSYLSQLPASVLKIDKSFIDGIVTNSDDAAIARTIVTLGHNLGMRVLAEGVENRQQIEFLQEAGCQEAQGYVFSTPVPCGDIPALAQTQNFLNQT